MHMPPTALLDALDELDDHTAAQLMPLLKAIVSALEARHQPSLGKQRLGHRERRQEPLWPEDEDPF